MEKQWLHKEAGSVYYRVEDGRVLGLVTLSTSGLVYITDKGCNQFYSSVYAQKFVEEEVERQERLDEVYMNFHGLRP